MSDATRTRSLPESKSQPFRGRESLARESAPVVKRTPDGREESDELAAVAVLSTN